MSNQPVLTKEQKAKLGSVLNVYSSLPLPGSNIAKAGKFAFNSSEKMKFNWDEEKDPKDLSKGVYELPEAVIKPKGFTYKTNDQKGGRSKDKPKESYIMYILLIIILILIIYKFS